MAGEATPLVPTHNNEVTGIVWGLTDLCPCFGQSILHWLHAFNAVKEYSGLEFGCQRVGHGSEEVSVLVRTRVSDG